MEEIIQQGLRDVCLCNRLEDVLSKWLIKFGTDEDDDFCASVKRMDEDGYNDSAEYRQSRLRGKRSR